ncbi:MAG: hypothetical protein ACQGVC_18045 [Myxococcota bacterium]
MSGSESVDLSTLAEDAGQHIPSDEGMRSVAALAERMQRLEREIEDGEAALKRKRAELQQVRTGDLPDAMAEVGISEFRLADGSGVSVAPFVSASLSQENPDRLKAMAWVTEQGDGAIIKHTIAVPFDRDSDADVETLKDLLREHGFGDRISEGVTVHPSTLRAYLKEKVADGAAVPLDLFRAFVGQAAKITPPKE